MNVVRYLIKRLSYCVRLLQGSPYRSLVSLTPRLPDVLVARSRGLIGRVLSPARQISRDRTSDLSLGPPGRKAALLAIRTLVLGGRRDAHRAPVDIV